MTDIATTTTSHSNLRQVRLEDISVDPRVQRKEGEDGRRVDAMASAFDPDALGVLILSERRDGSLVVLDGMHRRAAALLAGYGKPVNAIVFTGLSLAEEASLFLLYNNKKDPSAISRFAARVAAGDEVAIGIEACILSQGWRVSVEKTQPGVLSAITAAERVFRTGSGTLPRGMHHDVLNQTLHLITESWGYEPAGTQSPILDGVGQLYGRLGASIDTPSLAMKLQKETPRGLIGKARTLKDVQGGTTPAAMARTIVGIYNNRRRTNHLPEWVWTR